MNYTHHIKPYYLIKIHNEVIRLFSQSDNIMLLRLFRYVNKVKMRFLELGIRN